MLSQHESGQHLTDWDNMSAAAVKGTYTAAGEQPPAADLEAGKVKVRRITKEMQPETAAAMRKLIGVEEVEWADSAEPGLSIRVRKTSASWCFRARLGAAVKTYTIGPLTGGKAAIKLGEVREWVRDAKKMIRNGTDPAAYLQEMATGAPPKPVVIPKPEGRLKWPGARDLFIANVKQFYPEKTYVDYRNTLTTAKTGDFAAWEDKWPEDITTENVQALRARILARGKVRQADKTLMIVNICLKWLVGHASQASGLTESVAEKVPPTATGNLLKGDKREKKLGRVQTPEYLGENAWRLGRYDGPARARLVGALMMFAAQRVETCLVAEKSEFTPMLSGGIWDIPAAHIKSKKRHIIPLPPVAWGIVQQAIAMSPDDSPLVFPQVRKWRESDMMDGHLSYTAVRNALGPLKEISCHDYRRSLGTHCENELGIPLPDISAILDHAEGRSGNVTAERYALGDRKHFKWRILSAWETWLLAQIAKHAPEGAPVKVPTFLNAPKVADTRLQAALEKSFADGASEWETGWGADR
jgi:Arm DNA-binding domain